MYQQSILENGLRVITHHLKDRDSLSLGFWVDVGGRYETDAIRGAAHFLEHVVFKGSQKYTCDAIKRNIEGVGGMLNAFTSEEQTCYFAKIPYKHLDVCFDVLSDMVFFPRLKSADIQKESTVILEEIKMYRDVPQYHVAEILDGLLWPDHPLGVNLAGTPETVMAMTSRTLKAFHRCHYNPANIVVAAAGHLDHDHLMKWVESKLTSLFSGHKSTFESFQKTDRPSQKFQFKVKPIEQMHVALGMPCYDENDSKRHAMNLLNIILGGNMSSRLFVRVREQQGLAYTISTSFKAMHDTGSFTVRAGVDNQKLSAALALIIKELQKIAKNGVRDHEVGQSRDYLLGQLMLSLEDTMDHMLWMGESLLIKNKVKTMKQLIKSYESLTPSDIRSVAREILDPRQYKLAIIGPMTHQQSREVQTLFESLI